MVGEGSQAPQGARAAQVIDQEVEMGLAEYKASQELELRALEIDGNAFYSLLMAALRQADTWNLEILKDGFPGVYDELMLRRNAPGGLLQEEMGGPGAVLSEYPQAQPGSFHSSVEDQG